LGPPHSLQESRSGQANLYPSHGWLDMVVFSLFLFPGKGFGLHLGPPTGRGAFFGCTLCLPDVGPTSSLTPPIKFFTPSLVFRVLQPGFPGGLRLRFKPPPRRWVPELWFVPYSHFFPNFNIFPTLILIQKTDFSWAPPFFLTLWVIPRFPHLGIGVY